MVYKTENRTFTIRNIMRYSSSCEVRASRISSKKTWFYTEMNNPFKVDSADSNKFNAERINGWAAMMGFWAAVGAYLTTGQIIPGLV